MTRHANLEPDSHDPGVRATKSMSRYIGERLSSITTELLLWESRKRKEGKIIINGGVVGDVIDAPFVPSLELKVIDRRVSLNFIPSFDLLFFYASPSIILFRCSQSPSGSVE